MSSVRRWVARAGTIIALLATLPSAAWESLAGLAALRAPATAFAAPTFGAPIFGTPIFGATALGATALAVPALAVLAAPGFAAPGLASAAFGFAAPALAVPAFGAAFAGAGAFSGALAVFALDFDFAAGMAALRVFTSSISTLPVVAALPAAKVFRLAWPSPAVFFARATGLPLAALDGANRPPASLPLTDPVFPAAAFFPAAALPWPDLAANALGPAALLPAVPLAVFFGCARGAFVG